jgi:hypothetical protein
MHLQIQTTLLLTFSFVLFNVVNAQQTTRDQPAIKDYTSRCLTSSTKDCQTFNYCCERLCPNEQTRDDLCYIFLSEIVPEHTYCRCDSTINTISLTVMLFSIGAAFLFHLL